ncbi:hypothetical protein D1816_13725 [Aquimarina sp. AD10]|uniref:hypothetical protein n=1 Tax=Aquimarina sp. AD10 TaxID=1714849 RepID=UPI000E4C7F39|nr:hypothetical protein [Aquimarina sp. AD10]AXT61360.1 hypothetical protein D1816_13725 [Aquimarina sp. AD10]RKN01446.1 hypothetical protein D7033_04250 [Aquimarina sp. AD10]
MLQKIASYNPVRKNLLAIEHSQRDGNYHILGLELALKKGELDIVNRFIVTSIGQLSSTIKNLGKASLAITDTQILTKELSSVGTDNEILSEAFPNLNLDDFYYQILKTSTKSFVAVCRKQHIDSIIQQYQKAKIEITEISLGNLKMAALSSHIDSDEISSNSAIIKVDNGEISAMLPKGNTTENIYTIEGLTLDYTYTLPLAIALNYFLHQINTTGSIEIKNQSIANEYKESQFFKKTLQFGIGFLLISLLINFFVFNTKYKKWQELQGEIQVYTTQNESIKNQQESVDTKEAIVKSILNTGFSKSSLYIDQIIKSQPTTVILNSFVYQPISKTIRSDKPIAITKNMISVAGNSIDKADFTTWINTIESLDFVDTVTIIKYGIDKKNISSFEIMINLIHDTAK